MGSIPSNTAVYFPIAVFIAVLESALALRNCESNECRGGHAREVFKLGPAGVSTLCDESGDEWPTLSIMSALYDGSYEAQGVVVERVPAGEIIEVPEFKPGGRLKKLMFARIETPSGKSGWVPVERLEKVE